MCNSRLYPLPGTKNFATEIVYTNADGKEIVVGKKRIHTRPSRKKERMKVANNNQNRGPLDLQSNALPTELSRHPHDTIESIMKQIFH